ncbi:hypothetical protein CWB85_06710 [Pseudoalteromonas sp. S1727]|uniref:hypothetical protein n=1 Tax=Pseudoalteromonas sp. S1727 TaxID=2066514 RepID=UPI00110831AB|nr:hypothetical protein [Pseudoalteromonas sp. S1727]TMN72493.1 hypothetical protein CWB85_06710 [Pseudoalteromonas sp. S1727]
MSIFKYLGGALPRKTIFNQFFEQGNTLDLQKKFSGLCLLAKWYYTKKTMTEKNPQRFQTHSCGNSPIRLLLFGPMFLGFVGSCVVAIFFIVYPFSEDSFPWWFLNLVLCWNLLFLNLFPLWDLVFSPKYAYFDRLTGKVGYTFDIPGCDERDEFGNCCFDWRDMKCVLVNQSTDQGGSRAFFPVISHKDRDKYPDTKMTIVVTELAQNPIYCLLFWERLVRFMDNTKPLPDIPEYEGYRYLDPITAEFDKQNNRPEVYWRDMSFKQQTEIYDELYAEAYKIDWYNDAPQPEITKPWQRWTPEPERKETLNWKYKAKRLFLQLTCGIP